MYIEHNPVIAAGMRADPETFIQGALFAVLSIRQPVIYVPDMLREVSREGRTAQSLFGSKRDAYDHLQEHGTAVWAAVTKAATARAAVQAAMSVPGLGIVKGAFVAQLAGHDVACLDSRNMKRLGMDHREWRTDGKPAECPALQRKLDKYMSLVSGRAREFWDDWCSDVGPRWKMTADEVSALHLAIVN